MIKFDKNDIEKLIEGDPKTFRKFMDENVDFILRVISSKINKAYKKFGDPRLKNTKDFQHDVYYKVNDRLLKHSYKFFSLLSKGARDFENYFTRAVGNVVQDLVKEIKNQPELIQTIRAEDSDDDPIDNISEQDSGLDTEIFEELFDEIEILEDDYIQKSHLAAEIRSRLEIKRRSENIKAIIRNIEIEDRIYIKLHCIYYVSLTTKELTKLCKLFKLSPKTVSKKITEVRKQLSAKLDTEIDYWEKLSYKFFDYKNNLKIYLGILKLNDETPSEKTMKELKTIKKRIETLSSELETIRLKLLDPNSLVTASTKQILFILGLPQTESQIAKIDTRRKRLKETLRKIFNDNGISI